MMIPEIMLSDKCGGVPIIFLAEDAAAAKIFFIVQASVCLHVEDLKLLHYYESLRVRARTWDLRSVVGPNSQKWDACTIIIFFKDVLLRRQHISVDRLRTLQRYVVILLNRNESLRVSTFSHSRTT